MLLLVEQYVEPAIRNTKPSFDNGDYLRILERILKLAIPTLYVWLCIFYSLFHAWLNILAEFLHFGDREFYKVPFGKPFRHHRLFWNQYTLYNTD